MRREYCNWDIIVFHWAIYSIFRGILYLREYFFLGMKDIVVFQQGGNCIFNSFSQTPCTVELNLAANR